MSSKNNNSFAIFAVTAVVLIWSVIIVAVTEFGAAKKIQQTKDELRAEIKQIQQKQEHLDSLFEVTVLADAPYRKGGCGHHAFADLKKDGSKPLRGVQNKAVGDAVGKHADSSASADVDFSEDRALKEFTEDVDFHPFVSDLASITDNSNGVADDDDAIGIGEIAAGLAGAVKKRSFDAGFNKGACGARLSERKAYEDELRELMRTNVEVSLMATQLLELIHARLDDMAGLKAAPSGDTKGESNE